jgi:hypothetical protein
MIGTILLCQILAPHQLLGIPDLLRNLKLTSIKDVPREVTPNRFHYVDGSNNSVEYATPAHTVIKAKHMKGNVSIYINRESGELMSWHITPSTDHGSGEIGVLALGLPGIILSLPILLPVWCSHYLIRKISGKHLQELILWLRLKGQVTSEVAKDLDIALNHKEV